MSKEKTIPVSVVCENDTEIKLLKQHNDGVKKLTSSQVDNLVSRIVKANTEKEKKATTTTFFVTQQQKLKNVMLLNLTLIN